MKRLVLAYYSERELQQIDEDYWNDSYIDEEDIEESNVVNDPDTPFQTVEELLMANLQVGQMAYIVDQLGDYQDRQEAFVDLNGTIHTDNNALAHWDILSNLASDYLNELDEDYERLTSEFIEELNDDEINCLDDIYDNDKAYEFEEYLLENDFDLQQYDERQEFAQHSNRDGVNCRTNPSEIISILDIDSFGFGSVLDDGIAMLDVATVNLPLSSFIADRLGSSELDCSEIYIRSFSQNGYIVERTK